MDQSVAPAPQSFLFAEFGDLAQQTLLDFGFIWTQSNFLSGFNSAPLSRRVDSRLR